MTNLASGNKALTIRKTLSGYSSLRIKMQADKSHYGGIAR